MTLNYSKQIPVRESADVVVCGGGPSGFIAAVAAARCGAKTLLIEKYGFLGGCATASYVVPISGFFFKGEQAVDGIPFEFVGRLCDAGAATVEYPKGNVSFNPEYYKLIAARMVAESRVRLLTNSFISDIVRDGNKLTHVIINNKSGVEAVAGKIFIDATGDGDVCALAGVPMLEPDKELQPSSMCFLLGGVDLTTPLLRDCIHHDGKGGRGSQNNVIRSFLLGEAGIPDFCGPWFNYIPGMDAVAVNVTRAGVDATDNRDYARAEAKLREDMFAIIDRLRKKYPEFSSCQLLASAINAGVRETRHIKGRHVLTGEDMQTGRVFDCPVTGCSHPMDIHAASGAGQSLTSLTSRSYVPYDSMVAEGFGNLIAAGRCISADRNAFASIRVQATGMGIGEAAGVAAAFALSRNIPTDEIAEKHAKEFSGMLAAFRSKYNKQPIVK